MNRLAKLTGIVRSLGSRAAGPQLRCSFCGKGADEVERLVAGPSVYICDECVKACVAVIEQHGGFPPSPPAGEDRLTHA